MRSIVNPGKGITLYEGLKSASMVLKSTLSVENLSEDQYTAQRKAVNTSKVIEFIYRFFLFSISKVAEITKVSHELEYVRVVTYLKLPFIKLIHIKDKHIKVQKGKNICQR